MTSIFYATSNYLVFALGPAVPDTHAALRAARHAPDGGQEVYAREPRRLLNI